MFSYSSQVKRRNEHDFVAHAYVSQGKKTEREQYIDGEEGIGIQQCLNLSWQRIDCDKKGENKRYT